MASIKTLIGFLVAVLVIGTGFFVSPEVGYAQAVMNGASSAQTECKLEKEDDDDDDKADQAKLVKEAQITMEQARSAALGRVAGTVLKEEIERENGRLQFTFDVCKEGKIYDVEVDAKTGAVLQAGLDDEDDDEDGEENDSPEMQAKFAKEAKISIEQARNTALGRVSGKITEEELEMENGKLVYSIEIQDANKKTFDVEVDAKTGVIVNVEEENDDDDGGDDDK